MSTFSKTRTAVVTALLVASGGMGTVAAQEAGTSASVILSNDLAIEIDGQLDDWAGIEGTTTVGGPQPSADPGTNGRLRWQIAADQETIYFAATITDASIIAGQHGENYWNEDSIELYVNFSGDLASTEYGPGITQIRLAANDIGTGGLASLTGLGLDQVDVTGVVFATDEGWGTEIAVDVSTIAQPMTGDRFGLQVHANGASVDDRDLKVIWSARDTNDTSFQDPSVFGQGVFIEGVALEPVESTTGENPPETVGVEAEAATGAVGVESIIPDAPELETTDDPRRALLYSAIASAVFVFGGGLWLERKRRRDEAAHLLAREAVMARDVTTEAGLADGATEEEFQEMLESILEEGSPTDGFEP